MFARDFRAWAREILKGNWAIAILVGLVGSLLGGGLDLVSGLNGGTNLDVQASAEAADYAMQIGPYSIAPNNPGLLDFIPRELWAMLVTITLVSTLLALIIGGAVTLGMSSYHLNLIFRREARFGDLFSQFHRLWAGFCMNFVMGFFIMLWSLLFVIPGVIAVYRYAMVPYLMAEFPELRVMEAIRESKRLMKGNKWRLFCLHFSFIGWDLLCTLTMGVGYLWLSPYRMAADTAFYMEVTGRSGVRELA